MQKNTLDQLLTHGVRHGASDLHFLVGDRPSYRIDGTLRPVKCEPLAVADTQRIASHLLGADATKETLAEIQEHDCSYSVEGVARFRVNLFRQRGSLCAILRVIPTKVPTLESLQLPIGIRKLAEETRGLVLVTGATGSGKSSTLAAMIDHVNASRPAHILTIEDPIEFLHAHKRASISQREVGPDTRSFTQALRAALRQDPDIILVGEMRDPETIDIALKAAETGHMVFSTVHTTDAAKTIGRLIGVFPADEQQAARMRLADNLKGVISQRLLPLKDAKGRVVAAEIMVVTKSIQELIKDPSRTGEIKDMIEKGRDQYSMQSFDQHLTLLYRSGRITLDVAKTAASNPSDFERALNFTDTSSDYDTAPVGNLEEPSFVEDDDKPAAEAAPSKRRSAAEADPILELFDEPPADDSLELA